MLVVMPPPRPRLPRPSPPLNARGGLDLQPLPSIYAGDDSNERVPRPLPRPLDDDARPGGREEEEREGSKLVPISRAAVVVEEPAFVSSCIDPCAAIFLSDLSEINPSVIGGLD